MIAEKLLQFSVDDEREARKLVADLGLGTKNQRSGRSVFQEYKRILEEGKLLELIYSRMNTHIVEAWSEGRRRLRCTKEWRTNRPSPRVHQKAFRGE
jgi:hypothetical protein